MKMSIEVYDCRLYDNPQIASIYLDGFQCTGKSEYATVVRGILDYMLRDLHHDEGGFFSAEVMLILNYIFQTWLWELALFYIKTQIACPD